MASKRTNSGFDNVQESQKRGRSEITIEPEDGRPGDWICPNDSCKHHNYKFRQICQKCFTNKYGEHVETVIGKKTGDWNCPIDGNLNYAWRTHCQKCETPGPRGGGMPNKNNYKNPNDWTCPSCNFHVYASRSSCPKCGCMRQAMGRMQGMGQFGFQGMGQQNYGFGFGGNQQRGLKAGDWTCPNCGDLVYASRSSCRKCQTPKPMGAQRNGGNDNRQSTGRPGDWTCPKCQDHVYASRSNCRKCDTAKPENAQLAPSSLPELFGGDWRCPKCFDHVYASRDACRKCNTAKPEANA